MHNCQWTHGLLSLLDSSEERAGDVIARRIVLAWHGRKYPAHA